MFLFVYCLLSMINILILSPNVILKNHLVVFEILGLFWQDSHQHGLVFQATRYHWSVQDFPLLLGQPSSALNGADARGPIIVLLWLWC